MSRKDPIILHIPHNSTDIPEQYRPTIVLSDEDLKREIIEMTDMHTADLYQLEKTYRCIAPVSRLVVDVERFPDDEQEPMAARGMGMVYELTSDLETLRNPVSEDLKSSLKKEYYDPHHSLLEEMTAECLDRYNKCLIIDCHSFPSSPLPYENRPSHDPRPEICIGTDDFHTPRSLYHVLETSFEKKGYDVQKDTPFSGALVPLKYYGQDSRVQSIMIEVRRDLYMNEMTGEKSPDFDIIQDDLTDVMTDLANYFNN